MFIKHFSPSNPVSINLAKKKYVRRFLNQLLQSPGDFLQHIRTYPMSRFQQSYCWTYGSWSFPCWYYSLLKICPRMVPSFRARLPWCGNVQYHVCSDRGINGMWFISFSVFKFLLDMYKFSGKQWLWSLIRHRGIQYSNNINLLKDPAVQAYVG